MSATTSDLSDPTRSLIDHVCPKIRDLGWAHYFAAETVARGEELGLDFLKFYVVGRGGVLGDVEASVVSSAFGYFKPSLIADQWNAACAVIAPRAAGREYGESAARYGRAKLSDVAGLETFCEAAGAVNDAADDNALALYAGWKAEPLADDPPARAMQLTAVLRELRGSAHLLAVRASGVLPRQAHAVARPRDLAMFGWQPEDVPEPTEADRTGLAAAEVLTDRLVAPAYAVLDGSGATALRDGIDAIEAALVG